jgi:hypothetical protein
MYGKAMVLQKPRPWHLPFKPADIGTTGLIESFLAIPAMF